MIRKVPLAIAIMLWGCAEPPPPPVEGEVILRAVRHAQDQVDDGVRPRHARSASAESDG